MKSDTFVDRDDIIAAVVRVLDAEHSVVAAYLFGSYGTGWFNSESDIDIGILLGQHPHSDMPDFLFDLRYRLEEAAKREVDLVCLGSVSPILGMQVLRHGRKIQEKDRRVAEEFFVRTVESYADLKLVRREIEARVLDGSIYG